MSEAFGQERLHEQLRRRLEDVGVAPTALEELASNLLWRIGRVSEDGPVTVRVGLASSAGLFQHLPRLRSASEAEIEAAVREASVKVEWVGARPRPGER